MHNILYNYLVETYVYIALICGRILSAPFNAFNSAPCISKLKKSYLS